MIPNQSIELTRVKDLYHTSLMGFKSSDSAVVARTVVSKKKASDAANAKDAINLISGYTKTPLSMTANNQFGDILAGAMNTTDNLSFVANSFGMTPALSMSKKLAYKGFLVEPTTIDFNLFLEPDASGNYDPIRSIFKPITDLLTFALPSQFGDENTSARNILKALAKQCSIYSNAAYKSASSASRGDAVADGTKAIFSSLGAITLSAGQAILDFVSQIKAMDAWLADVHFLNLPYQLSLDMFLYQGYSNGIKQSLNEFSRSATFITGPWLISSISVKLGELVIHPGLPDTATVTIGLIPAITGDGDFFKDMYTLDKAKQ